MKTKKGEIPRFIKDIYIAALKENLPLKKLMFNAIETDYNRTRMRAAHFVNYYIVEKNDNNK